ncbi:MAG: zinc-ribbon domain-containing protein [Deltaproteobacteria bacterium]|nr:zinc-ribbon domain-containing protein [Deltaproteobacteria bacterium]MBW1927921.1 zinc-ribbon domain-containing protein [Deltaproteobacteria bacterium]MBW2024838.1 zinc-ribbon domain-containing protein [Deltaproteobacteria bacterium]MBW2124784.1 zinc-ribbon domain-containing protein [Deltaproteobacteria bacterium]RLB19882.1 MAG: hypothetical protein DRG63_00180 [Deltaproteobacteria bacterium]
MTIEIKCPYCGFSRHVPKEKIPPNAKWAVCPRCRQRFEFYQDIRFEEAGPEGTEKGPRHRQASPWERRGELGFWQAASQTFKGVMFAPDKLFSQLSFEAGKKEPLAFGLLAGSIGSMFGFFWQLVLVSLGVVAFGPPILGHLGMWFIFLMMIVIVPILVLVGLYVYAGVLHLLLLIVRGAQNGFEATFRVVCFSQATQILGIVPFLGGWVAGIWQLIVQIVGLKEIHETSYLRVIIAFLIPVILVILFVLAVVIPLVIYLVGKAGTGLPWQW